MKRPVGLRERRPAMSPYPARGRPLPPPARSYDRKPPGMQYFGFILSNWFCVAIFIMWNNYIGLLFSTVPAYPKSSFKREYGRRDEVPPPRSRVATDYGSRAVPERRQSYRDDYTPRGPGYSDPPRSTSRTGGRRAYVDEGYGQRYERHPPPSHPPPSYREGRARDYDSISGSKRPYSALVSVTGDLVCR